MASEDEKIEELPDDLRVPLHSLEADIEYLFGRVAMDGSCAPAMANSVLERLHQIEDAWNRRAAQPVASAAPADLKVRNAVLEEAAKVADAEEAQRLDQMYRAEGGEQTWGLDTQSAALAQGHKALTAKAIAASIRAIKDKTPPVSQPSAAPAHMKVKP